MAANRGDLVLVRTYGDYPALRVFWASDGEAALVVEPEFITRAEAGDLSVSVGVPIEDVFLYGANIKFDPRVPYQDWSRLNHAW